VAYGFSVGTDFDNDLKRPICSILRYIDFSSMVLTM